MSLIERGLSCPVRPPTPARGVSVRCIGHRLRMIYTVDTIRISFTYCTGPAAASSAILRRELLNSFRIKERSAVRPRQYCDRRRRGNAGCRTFDIPLPLFSRQPASQKDACRICLSADTETQSDGRWSGSGLFSGLFTARGSCLSGHLSGATPTQCFLWSHPGCRRPLLAASGTQRWVCRRERAVNARGERSYAFTEAQEGAQRGSTSRCGCRLAGLRTAAW